MPTIAMTSGAIRAQSIVGTSEGRDEADFYPTPVHATEALLRVETFQGVVWEPACGDGAMSRVLEQHGLSVKSSDLYNRGYGEAPHDFLTSKRRSTNVVTNPPFSMAQEFVEHALQQTNGGKVALLLKIQFLESVGRKELFATTPLKKVWVFSKRLSLSRNGAWMPNKGMMCFCWFVWDHQHEGDPTLGWL